MKVCLKKLEFFGWLPGSENSMIQAAFVFTRYQLVTDRRTDSAAIPKSRASIPADDIQKQM